VFETPNYNDLMTRPSNFERCKKCGQKFSPSVEVELLPVFNAVDKSKWLDTACPNCGFRFKIARLSKNSFDVCLFPTKKLPGKPYKESEYRFVF
jgi:DNA-directed RNA polymerase subunit RPC12/RpoP